MRVFAHSNSKTLILISILTASLDPTHDPVYKHLEEIFGKNLMFPAKALHYVYTGNVSSRHYSK